MAPGTKVYVRWYGNVLEGEVADGDGFMGMTPVRIPLDGHHPVALFAPGHVYQTEAEAGSLAQAKPVVKEIPKEVQEYIADVYVNDKLDRFKKSHWDEARNHLRIDALDEFYQLWRQTHTHQPDNNRYIVGVDPGAPAGDVRVVLPLKPPPLPVHHKPQPKRKIRCWRCENLDYDYISDTHENVGQGEHFCGLHGCARVDPDGPQVDLDHKGGCGFIPRKQIVELSLF